MKKVYLLTLLLIVSAQMFAQINFEQVLPPSPAPQILPVFEAVDSSAIAYADVDGVNGLDVLITGLNNAGDRIAKLYLNDGAGNYSEKEGTPFVGVTEGSIAFADVDADGSQDVVISGYNGTDPTTNLYLNDGDGNFSIDGSANLLGVREAAIAFADFDAANGPDLLITGRFLPTAGPPLVPKSTIFINDGNGSFTEINQDDVAAFADVNKGAVAVADLDGQNGLDVIISGIDVAFGSPVTEAYRNDGTGSFTQVAGTPFLGIRDGDIALADVDGNGTQDLLISGFDNSNGRNTRLYTNDGSASFTEVASGIEDLGFSAIAFADVDGANGLDVLISGINGAAQDVSTLYLNDGSGAFTASASYGFEELHAGDLAFFDLDNDTNDDLVLVGKSASTPPFAEIYVNDGSGGFERATGTAFEGVSRGDGIFADIDEDGDQDILITGNNNDNPSIGITKVYFNDGNAVFTEVTTSTLAGVGASAAAFADVDGVNGPDVLISGLEPGFPQVYGAKLYKNDGSGSFNAPDNLIQLQNGSIAFADVDGVNGSDVVITGSGPDTGFSPNTTLYMNDGSGNFTAAMGTPFADVDRSSIAFADMDGQNGPDLVLTGNSGLNGEANIYLNDGNGSFSLQSGTPFEAVQRSAIAVGDVDGDGSNDLLITGENNSGDPIAKLYTNDGTVGNPTFTELSGTPFEAVFNSAAVIADIDGVNGNDIIIAGENSSGDFITKLYVNDGSGGFSEVMDLPFQAVSEASLAVADADSDGLLDILLTGLSSTGQKVSILYRNLTDFVPPSITSATTVSVDENVATAFYTATADEEVTFSLGSTKDESFFTLNGADLRFTLGADFENPLDANADNIYLVDLIATDVGGNEVSQEVAVTVTDVTEAGPVITSPASVSVEENVTGVVYTATADVSATFSLGSAKDEAEFVLNGAEINFVSAPDFENPTDGNADNTYELDVIAADGDGNSTTKAVSVVVTNVDETGPVITSPASVSVEENVTGVIYTATADVSATFSLGSAKDETEFNLSGAQLSFSSSPDFENPTDANSDNIYELDIIATDGDGFSTTKAITVTVTDFDESGGSSLQITSPPSVTVEENVTSVIYNATASSNATFSLGAVKDGSLFSINSGAISFNTAPDFENPTDENEDNTYEVDLIASDGSASVTLALSIIVTDVDDAPLSNREAFTGKIYPNPVQNILTIEHEELMKASALRIFDARGRIQKMIPFKGGQQKIDLSDLQPGIYMMRLQVDGKNYQHTFLKE